MDANFAIANLILAFIVGVVIIIVGVIVGGILYRLWRGKR